MSRRASSSLSARGSRSGFRSSSSRAGFARMMPLFSRKAKKALTHVRYPTTVQGVSGSPLRERQLLIRRRKDRRSASRAARRSRSPSPLR